MIRLPAVTASSCIERLLAKLASPTWAMLAPGRPSSISARTGLPLLRPWSRSRMSKWASRVMRPTFSRSPIARTAGRVTALLPPTSSVNACASALAATARMREPSHPRCSNRRSRRRRGPLRECQAPAPSRHHSARSAAAFREERRVPDRSVRALPTQPRAERRAMLPAHRDGPRDTRSERLGQPAIALTLAAALA